MPVGYSRCCAKGVLIFILLKPEVVSFLTEYVTVLLRLRLSMYVTLLKPTGHVMHQQINIQQLYVLPTLYLCVLYLSENKQRLVPLTA